MSSSSKLAQVVFVHAYRISLHKISINSQHKITWPFKKNIHISLIICSLIYDLMNEFCMLFHVWGAQIYNGVRYRTIPLTGRKEASTSFFLAFKITRFAQTIRDLCLHLTFDESRSLNNESLLCLYTTKHLYEGILSMVLPSEGKML